MSSKSYESIWVYKKFERGMMIALTLTVRWVWGVLLSRFSQQGSPEVPVPGTYHPLREELA